MIKTFTLATSIALLLTLPLSASAASPSPAGKAVKVSGSATSSGINGKKTLSTGGSVFQGDIIKTGFASHVQLLFSDETKLVVGPRSRVSLDEYVLGEEKTVSSFAIKAARGTFRFISGNSEKSAYKISTKTATIGIRGTGFDFAARGRTSLVLYNGSVQVCVKNSCATLTIKCELAQESHGRIGKSNTNQLVPNAFKLTFPFIRRENRLLPEFRLGAGGCDSTSGSDDKNGGNNGNSGGASKG